MPEMSLFNVFYLLPEDLPPDEEEPEEDDFDPPPDDELLPCEAEFPDLDEDELLAEELTALEEFEPEPDDTADFLPPDDCCSIFLSEDLFAG
jgi:hypothetical protein